MLKKGMPDAAVKEDDGNINLSNGLERKKEALVNKENLSDNLDFSEDIEETHELLIELQEVQKALDELRKANKIGLEADPYVQNVREKVSDAQKQLEVLRRSRGEDDDLRSIKGKHIGTINNQAYDELNNQLQTVADTANEVDKEFSQAEQTLGKVRERVSDINQEATELYQNSKKIQDTVTKGDKDIQSLKATRDFNQTQENRAGENALDSQKNVDDQQDIKGILDTLNAVQQLTFA
jgi:chromosome segregation ATPase